MNYTIIIKLIFSAILFYLTQFFFLWLIFTLLADYLQHRKAIPATDKHIPVPSKSNSRSCIPWYYTIVCHPHWYPLLETRPSRFCLLHHSHYAVFCLLSFPLRLWDSQISVHTRWRCLSIRGELCSDFINR